MEYIILHGYIRNTPSDTEVHVEHQLIGVLDQWKRIYRTMQNLVGQRNWGENSLSRTETALCGWGN